MKKQRKEDNKKRIPKIIHYFWFGNGELPDIFKTCLESWKANCPDYEIKRWDESNFDVNITNYTREAYEQKKYAFVSDYARFYIIEKYGGIYLDIDVEMIKPIDDLLVHESFCGFEYNSNSVNPGLILGSIPHGDFVSSVLDFYNSQKEFTYGTHTVCTISTDILNKKYGLDLNRYKDIQELDKVCVYPAEFFCAYDQIAKKKMVNDKTICVHHYNASWLTTRERMINFIKKIIYIVIGKKNYEKLKKTIKK